MSENRGAGRAANQLRSADVVRAYQRKWLEETRRRVSQGEPFVICHGDDFEDECNIMDIPVIVINYWNSVIGVKRMVEYYTDVLAKKGYPVDGVALGLASTLDNKPEIAPWGGLPKPAVIVGGRRYDLEMRVLEIWAREYGCTIWPLEFTLGTSIEKPPEPRWWERRKDHWDEMIDPPKLDVRVEEEKGLIRFLEVTTGKKFSIAKLNQAMELRNEQMEYWGKVRDLIAETVPCPVSLRDQLAMYQAMWHRGTTEGRDFIKAYYEEVKERVEEGVSACPNEKLRLMLIEGTPPAWERYVEEKYGAVCVCSFFSSIPIDAYARTILNNDPLRTLAGCHMLLFSRTYDWYLKDAMIHKCNGIVGAGWHMSGAARFCEKAGMPVCEIPRYSDDPEVRSILDTFIERLLSKSR